MKEENNEKVGQALLKMLQKHFGREGPMESFDEDLGAPMKAKGALRKKMRARQEGAYGSEDSDVDDYEPDMDEEEDEDGQYLDDYDDEGDQDHETEGEDDEREIPKEQRKRMSIAVLSKKFSKPKRKNM